MFLTSSKIGLFSVGGGISGWMFREYVLRLRWLGEKDFLSDMAVARVLPGTNVSNMTVMLGYRLLGLPGAAAGLLGLLLGPFLLLMLVLAVYDRIAGSALEAMLQGAAAGALGPVAYLAYRSAVHGASEWHTALVLAAVAAAAVFKMPLVAIVALALPAGIALVWAVRRRS